MDITTLFCDIDDFVKQHNQTENLIESTKPSKHRLSSSEIMTICIAYHQSGYKNFKAFYLEFVIKYLISYFPKLISYNRFLELKSSTVLILTAYLTSKFGTNTGISFIDSTPIQVCKPKRMSRNKVFKDFAAKGKSTIGWFFGFKAHIVVNEVGELLSVKLTPGNVDDRTPVPKVTENIKGKMYGDKGYISKKLCSQLLDKGLHLITGIRKNMKNKLLELTDKILLRKRSIIETINDQLKNISNTGVSHFQIINELK